MVKESPSLGSSSEILTSCVLDRLFYFSPLAADCERKDQGGGS